jgi:type IV pilus assembly protein PilQ
VTTPSNATASISQGTQIPVQTTVNNVTTLQFLTFALSLGVTPRVTDDGRILMTVSIEDTSADFAAAVNGVPQPVTRQAEAMVLLTAGGTAVLGGIQHGGTGGDGATELLLFITPRIKPAP